MESDDTTRNLPIAVKTIAASASSACFRILLTPIDTLKTTLQTTGKDGISILRQKVRVNGVGVMWYGALASASATFIGHYPWFATVKLYHIVQYNVLILSTIIFKKQFQNEPIQPGNWRETHLSGSQPP